MKSSTAISAICGAAALALCVQAHAETSLTWGGDIELDTDLVSNPGGSDGDDANMGGRVKLSAEGLHETDRGYIKGVGQLLIQKDGDTGVDDVYARFGSGGWGIQIGRFEAIDLFSKGVDTLYPIIGNTNHYQASAARGRTSDTGQIMFDTDFGRGKFELATIWGETDATGTGEEGEVIPAEDDDAIAGFRPAIFFMLTDDLNITAGYDYVESGNTETSGFGIYVRYATDLFALKMNYASGEQETNGVTNWENDSYNINIESGNFFIGYTNSEDEGGDTAETIYTNYSIPGVFGVDSATFKIAVASAKADSVPETENSIRFRINYTF